MLFFRLLRLLELFYGGDIAHCIARDVDIDDEYYELEMSLIHARNVEIFSHGCWT